MKPISEPLDFYLLIPCYNNKEGLIRSLQSVQYNPGRFGMLIVDDGSSTPISLQDLVPHLHPDIQIDILTLPGNRGITAALNAGLQNLLHKPVAPFIARLDAGDLCTADRFYKQVAFLAAHPDIDLLGSWCIHEDYEKGTKYEYRTPVTHGMIRKGMYFRNIFVHPSVMWRASALEKVPAYPDNFPHAEDYGFFYSLMKQGNVAVIPESLLTKEMSKSSISLVFRRAQLRSRMKVVRQFGESKWLVALGVVKIWLLLAAPYSMVLQAKKLLYTTR